MIIIICNPDTHTHPFRIWQGYCMACVTPVEKRSGKKCSDMQKNITIHFGHMIYVMYINILYAIMMYMYENTELKTKWEKVLTEH